VTLSRDIRLSAEEIIEARDAVARRRRQIEKQLERSSYATQPHAKDRMLDKLSRLRELEATFEHARKQLGRQLAAHVLSGAS